MHSSTSLGSEQVLVVVMVELEFMQALVVRGSTIHSARVDGQLPPRFVTVFRRVGISLTSGMR